MKRYLLKTLLLCLGALAFIPAVAAVGITITSSTNVSCNGGSDGQVIATVTPGTPNYTYTWSNGSTTVNTASTTDAISGLAAGTYTVTVTDAAATVAVASITITEPGILGVSIIAQTNVLCNGGSNGAATASGSGGTTPYTYSWSSGESVASISGKPAGTYTVTVDDANGCGPVTAVANITEPSAVGASISSQTNVSCNGGSDGAATASGSGGTAPYTYSWNSGESVASISGKTVGTYTVSISDANGCGPAVTTVNITEPPALTVSITSQTNLTCNGGGNGAATATGLGGVGPLGYNWSNGATTATVTNFAAGTHTVSVTDANGCGPVTASVTLTEPPALLATLTVDSNVTCNGASDGGISSSVSGGVSPYTLNWSNGATTASITGLPAGVYTLTVTDANSCTATPTATVTEPAPLLASATVDVNVSCNGFADGGATASATGGTTPYTFNWSTGAAIATITGLSAGTYTVTVVDANGCGPSTATATITEPTVLGASIMAQADVTCNGGSDGSATAAGSGGTAPYNYSWPTGATTATAGTLTAGTYTVTVADANGCIATSTAVINEPAALVASAVINSVPSCPGLSDASATASGSGGTTPYTFSWSTGATTASITGIAAGTYTVSVDDASACGPVTAEVIIADPVALSASIAKTNITCHGNNDGTATASGVGGTAPYTFSWSTGASTALITGLSAGTYTVSVDDANGCGPVTANVSITEPLIFTATITGQVNVSCNGGNNGGATASSAGGVLPHVYSWSSGESTASITGKTVGTYTVTVTDANGCGPIVHTVNITEPPTITVAITSQTNLNCNGAGNGMATASALGGVAPLAYNWSNGGTTATVTNFAAGTHTVSVTDANGCGPKTASVTLTQPPALVVNTTVNDHVSCNGLSNGAASVTSSGGVSPYTYNWSNGATTTSVSALSAGTYSVTVTDANSCTMVASATINQPAVLSTTAAVDSNVSCHGFANGGVTASVTGGTTPYDYSWSIGGSPASISGLTAGTYTVTVTDANGCTATANVSVSEPAVLVASITASTNVSCNGGSNGAATVGAAGGTIPYAYAWTSGQTTAAISSLTAGTYTATVTDAHGCTAAIGTTITQPAVLSIVATPVSVSCNAGSNGGVSLSVTGGTTGYSFNWSNGSTTQNISSLTSGTYTVTVTDGNGCTSAQSAAVTQPALLTSNVSTTDVSCNAGSDGAALAAPTGGTAPYTYAWSNGNSSALAFGLTAGNYTVTISDAHNCGPVIIPVTLVEPLPLVANVDVSSSVSCNGGNDGAATVAAAGGTSPYAFMWSTGESTNTETGLTAGFYTVTVTDDNGCLFSLQLIVEEPDLLTADIKPDHVTCEGGSDGEAEADVSGGTVPYSFTWDDPDNQTNVVAVGLAAGTYHVTVTDNNGCTVIDSVTLGELYANPVVDLGPDTVTGCEDTVVIFDAGIPGGGSYLWSTGDITQSLHVDTSGTYSVIATDVHGCFGTDTVWVILQGPCLGIGEPSRAAIDVRYYPNPSAGLLNMEIRGMQGQSVWLSVTDLHGRMLYSQHLVGLGDLHNELLDLSSLARGSYIIRLESEQGLSVNRVLIQ